MLLGEERLQLRKLLYEKLIVEFRTVKKHAALCDEACQRSAAQVLRTMEVECEVTVRKPRSGRNPDETETNQNQTEK